MRLKWYVPLFVMFLAGCGTPSFLITPVSGDSSLHEVPVSGSHALFAKKIVIIPLEGTIVNGRVGGLLQAQENPLSHFVQELNAAAADDSVRAVVIRVNSPGGSVTASDTMYDAVKRFKAATHKPVIVSAQEVDASGAYYVSCAADKIVANPTSIVGSIGVIFESFDVANGLNKLGIISIAIKSAELKDMGSPFKHLTDHEREVMQEMVDEYFARFKDTVTSNRPITDPATLKLVTDGRVFSGVRAKELGLVDEVGRLDDAIDLAKQMANVPDAEIIMFQHPYAYSGSIYAETDVPTPEAEKYTLSLPLLDSLMPDGFYYLWQP